jgi:hypothetical protein
VEIEETVAARQWLDKNVSTAIDMHATIEELLETASAMRSIPRT